MWLESWYLHTILIILSVISYSMKCFYCIPPRFFFRHSVDHLTSTAHTSEAERFKYRFTAWMLSLFTAQPDAVWMPECVFVCVCTCACLCGRVWAGIWHVEAASLHALLNLRRWPFTSIWLPFLRFLTLLWEVWPNRKEPGHSHLLAIRDTLSSTSVSSTFVYS